MNIRLFATLLLLLATALPAQEVLDQQFDPTGITNAWSLFNGNDKAQTFTVGIGGRLTTVAVYIEHLDASDPDLQVHVLPTVGGIPETFASALFSQTFSAAEIPTGPGWFNVNASAANITVSPGEVLAIAMSTGQTNSTYFWHGNYPGPYAGGDYYHRNLGTGITSWNLGNVDVGFRTYVSPIVLSDGQGYFSDFETGAAGFAPDAGVWELGAPAQGHISAASSGTSCWMTDLDAAYPGDAYTGLVSPWFDCSALVSDPILSFQITWATYIDDGVRIEIDRDDGQGFVTLGDTSFYNASASYPTATLGGIYWGGHSLNYPSPTTATWHEESHALTGAAGRSRVRVRFLFGSDYYNASDGAAIDDVRIEPSRIVVDADQAYFQDFEKPTDGWVSGLSWDLYGTATPLWERGTPSVPAAAPFSGARCYATDLDGLYPDGVRATLTSPPCDFSALTSDPMLELAIFHDLFLDTYPDGVRVEVDLDDGNGFQTLGSVADWYDGAVGTPGPGKVGWTGKSNGWRLPQHRITGAAGLSNVRLRILIDTGWSGSAPGALVDDIRIWAPHFTGTETNLGDDLRMQVYANGVREPGSADLYDVQPGDAIDVFSFSPEGNLVGGEYYLVAEVFTSNSSYVNVAPDVWISLAAGSVLLQGGVQPPFYMPTQMSPYGQTLTFYYTGGFPGWSCRVQALVFGPMALNGIYASSDAFELRLN